MKGKGFTLIELLIVVAIIAILAAIAVPNFLEAQVRSKVSRTKADLRSIATGVEAYAVDHNKFPVDGHKTGDGHPFWYVPGGPLGNNFGGITSPVAYITNVDFADPFRTAEDATVARDSDAPSEPPSGFPMPLYRRFRYRNFEWTYGTTGSNGTYAPATNLANLGFYQELYGGYQLVGNGPDKTWSGNAAGGMVPVTIGAVTRSDCNMIYDPTNGTISLGDIVRSQKQTEQRLRLSN